MEPIRLCIADTMRAWVSSLAVLNGRLENMVKIFSDLELEFRKVVRPKIIPLVYEKKKKKKLGIRRLMLLFRCQAISSQLV